ncbi:MAG: hypothetical protein ACE5LD_03115 [Candidatus Bipolaricaulia bacterium]
MMRKLSWLALIAITLLVLWLAYETDANYLEFIRATDRVQIVIHEGQLQVGKGSATITFVAEVINPSQVPLWVEALNYQLSINGQYGGADFMEEAKRGELTVSPGKKREISLRTELRADYLKLFLAAREAGEVLVNISGRARMGFEVGQSGIKAFDPFGGVIFKEGGSSEGTEG